MTYKRFEDLPVWKAGRLSSKPAKSTAQSKPCLSRLNQLAGTSTPWAAERLRWKTYSLLHVYSSRSRSNAKSVAHLSGFVNSKRAEKRTDQI